MTRKDNDVPAPGRSVGGHALRVLRGVIALLLLAFLGLWYVLETDTAAERVRRLLIARAAAALEQPVTIGHLALDVVPPRLMLEDVVVGDATTPLFAVDRARIEIGAVELLRPELSIENIELDRPRLNLFLPDRAEGGSGAVPDAPFAISVHRARITDGQLAIGVARAGIAGEVFGVNLSLAPEGVGRLGLGTGRGNGQLTIDSGQLDLTTRNGPAALLTPLELSVDYGTRTRIADLDRVNLSVGDSTITAEGTLRGLASLELELEADIALDDLFKVWVPPGPQDHAGRASFQGTFQVREAGPVVAGRLRTADSRFAGLDLDTFAADLQIRPGLVTLRNTQAQIYGGQLDVDMRFDTSVRPAQAEVTYRATGIDAAALTSWRVLGDLRLAGILDGEGTLQWGAPFLETLGGQGQVSMRVPDVRSAVAAAALRLAPSVAGVPGPRPAPALPLPGDVSLEYEAGAGRLSVRNARASFPGNTIELDGEVDLDGEVRADLRATSQDLRILDHVASQIRALSSDTASDRLGFRGRGEITLRLDGTTRAPTLTGSVSGRGVALADVRLGDLEADLRTVGGMLTADNLRIRRDGGLATGSAQLRLPARGATTPEGAIDYGVSLRMQDYQASVDLDADGRELRFDGLVDGDLEISGRFDAPLLAGFRVAGQDAILAGGRIDRFTLNGRKAEELWLIDRLVAEIGAGRLDATGFYGITDRELSLEARLDDVPMAGLSPWTGDDLRLDGTMSGVVTVAGPVGAFDGDATLHWRQARANDVLLGAVATSMRADGGVVAMRAVASPTTMPAAPGVARTAVIAATPLPQPPGDGWAASFTIGSTAPFPVGGRLTADAAVARLLLTPLGLELPPDLVVQGRADLTLEGRVAERDSWSGEGRIDGLQLRRGDFYATAASLTTVITDSELRVEGVLSTAAGELRLSPRVNLRDRTLGGELRGALPASVVHLLDPSVVASGELDLSVTLAGTTDRPRARGAVDVRGVEIDRDWPYPLEISHVEFEMAEGRLRTDSFVGTLGGHTLALSANLALDAITGSSATASSEVEISLESFPLEPLLSTSPAVARLVNQGAISGTARLSGTGLDPRDWVGAVDLDELTLRMQQYRTELQAPIVATVAGGKLTLPASTRLGGGQTDFGLAGTVDLHSGALDLTAVGALGFEALNVLSPYWGTGGIAELDLRVYGDPGDLAYQGHADLRDVVLSPPPLRQPVEDIAARLEFRDRRIRITDLSGALGGGEIQGSGEIFMRDNVPQSFRLAIDVDNALIRLERDVRFAASARVIHDGTPERSLLSGTVELHEAMYRREYTADRALLELLDAPETDPDPLLQSIGLALAVTGNEDIFIDNNLADVEVAVDFDLRGTAARPVVLGRTSLLSGRLYWNGNNFDVLQGTVEFNNPFETEPTFEIRARTEIRRYTVDMRFSGSLVQGVSFDYTSTPTLSDLELFNLLAFGEEPDSEIIQDRGRYQQALGLQATRYLTDAYFTEVESGARRLFGVDRFRISPTLSGRETDATARLTLGKRINRNVYLTYSRLLSTSEDQLITVEYQLSPRVRLKGTRDEDGSFGIDFLVNHRIRR